MMTFCSSLNIFSAVAADGLSSWISNDGVTWVSTVQNFTLAVPTTSFYSVVAQKLFAVQGYYESVDGVVFAENTTLPIEVLPIRELVENTDVVLVRGGNPSVLYHSFDGIDWNISDLPTPANLLWHPKFKIFFSFQDSGDIYTSSDGIAWALYKYRLPVGVIIRTSIYVPKLDLMAFVGVVGSNVIYSYDGELWRRSPLSDIEYLQVHYALYASETTIITASHVNNLVAGKFVFSRYV